MTLYLSNIADAISQISIAGITVKDKDQIVGDWSSTQFVLYPNPESWISGFTIKYDALMQGSTAPATISYNLNYRFLSVQVGDISVFPLAYSNLVDKVAAIVNAIIATPAPYSGRVEMILGDISVGPRVDPVGNNYFGADFSLRITEMQN